MKSIIAAFTDSGMAQQAASDLGTVGLSSRDVRIIDERTDNRSNLMQTLTQHGVPRDRAGLYGEVTRRGGALVLADADDANASRVAQLLDERGALDLDAAAQRWQSAGWTDYSETAEPFDENARVAERADLQRESLDVIEEEVHVGKRQVELGGVRLRTFITERPIHEDVQLREEHIEVQREAANERIAPNDASFTEEEFVVTAQGEEPVVEKQARVVERVRVDKDVETRTETIEDTERRRDVEVERIDPRRH